MSASATDLSAHRRGQHRPSILLLHVGQGLDLNHQAIACLRRWRVCLRWTSAARAARAADVCHEAIADGVIPPGAWTAPAASLAPALIRCDSRFGIRLTRKPLRVDILHLVGDGCGFLRLGSRIGLGVLLRQLTGMHHDKAQCLLDHPPLAVLHLDPAQHAVPMPASGRFRLGPPWLLHQQRQGGVLLSPGFEVLPYGTGPWDSRYQPDPVLQT